jgi:hypothetical protein
MNPMVGTFLSVLEGNVAVTYPLSSNETSFDPRSSSSSTKNRANFICVEVLGTDVELSHDVVSNFT